MAVNTFKASAHLQEGVKVKATSRHFELTIDEPKSLGGTDTGMNPVEALLASLGACQSIVARVYAPKFDIKLDDFQVDVEGDIDLDGFFLTGLLSAPATLISVTPSASRPMHPGRG